jgi:hypothetical protein
MPPACSFGVLFPFYLPTLKQESAEIAVKF